MAEPKPTDAQQDAWLNGDLEKIKGEALEKLDLKPHERGGSPIDPIMVVGPASQAKLAVGKDGIIRFSVYEVLVVYLTDYQLAVYQCVVDLVNRIKLSQATQEYHYTDVVSVTTTSVAYREVLEELCCPTCMGYERGEARGVKLFQNPICRRSSTNHS